MGSPAIVSKEPDGKGNLHQTEARGVVIGEIGFGEPQRPGDRESFLYYLAVEAPLRANVKDGRAGESERSPNYTSKCVCPHHASPPEYFFGVIRTIDRWQELLDPRILNSQSSVMISGNWKDGDSGLLDVLNDMGYLG
jgi:hypothetical protein